VIQYLQCASSTTLHPYLHRVLLFAVRVRRSTQSTLVTWLPWILATICNLALCYPGTAPRFLLLLVSYRMLLLVSFCLSCLTNIERAYGCNTVSYTAMAPTRATKLAGMFAFRTCCTLARPRHARKFSAWTVLQEEKDTGNSLDEMHYKVAKICIHEFMIIDHWR
jgi:hypothetical protein